MTFEEIKKELNKKVHEVNTGIHQVEEQTGIQLIISPAISIDNNERTAVVIYHGNNGIRYEIPYEVYLSVPTKRLIIEISRALTVEFNKFEDRNN